MKLTTRAIVFAAAAASLYPVLAAQQQLALPEPFATPSTTNRSSGEPEHSFLRAVHRALRQPLERRAEQTVWFASHIALCEAQPRSTKIFSRAPRSAYSSLTRAGGTCLSCTPVTINVGVWVFPTIAAFHPHVVVCGARRTPVPHVAPTGSDASICAHTVSLVA